MPTREGVIQAEMPLDVRGVPMLTARGELCQNYDLTTTAWLEIPVGDDTSEIELIAVADGAATSIAFIYGGARAGAPASGCIIPTGMAKIAACVGAPFIYVKATGAAADLGVIRKRRAV